MDFVVVGGVGGNLAEAAYPPLEGVHIIEAAADRPESQTVNGIPIIDVFFAAGWSGHGWAIAPAVCQLLAAWASARSRHCCVPSPMAAFWRKVLGP
jgi:sarcosine oxidase subunit beta